MNCMRKNITGIGHSVGRLLATRSIGAAILIISALSSYSIAAELRKLGPKDRVHTKATDLGKLGPLDPIHTKLVMNIIATCSNPIEMGPTKDGSREIWPIIGGKFEGPHIRGTIVPGGADYAVSQRDDVWSMDAQYRLLTDDGITIIIRNRGIWIDGVKTRTLPEFWAPAGSRYEWLNKATFMGTLSDVPPELALANGPDENDRLIQVYLVD